MGIFSQPPKRFGGVNKATKSLTIRFWGECTCGNETYMMHYKLNVYLGNAILLPFNVNENE